MAAFAFANSLNHRFNWGFNPVTLRGLTGLLTLIILAIGIYTAMDSMKRNNNGNLTYGQAVLAGLIVAVTTGVISAIVTFIYCQFINPDYAAYMISESRKVMVADGKSLVEIAANTADLQKQMTVPMQVIQSVIGQTVSGTVIALIIGVFAKTKK